MRRRELLKLGAAAPLVGLAQDTPAAVEPTPSAVSEPRFPVASVLAILPVATAGDQISPVFARSRAAEHLALRLFNPDQSVLVTSPLAIHVGTLEEHVRHFRQRLLAAAVPGAGGHHADGSPYPAQAGRWEWPNSWMIDITPQPVVPLLGDRIDRSRPYQRSQRLLIMLARRVLSLAPVALSNPRGELLPGDRRMVVRAGPHGDIVEELRPWLVFGTVPELVDIYRGMVGWRHTQRLGWADVCPTFTRWHGSEAHCSFVQRCPSLPEQATNWTRRLLGMPPLERDVELTTLLATDPELCELVRLQLSTLRHVTT